MTDALILGSREQQTSTPTGRRRRIPRPSREGVLSHVVLALFAYLPLLRNATGKVTADTKQYLYLDPSRVLERAWSMWDPNIGAGTVTHQNIGYLFPMGPYYWVMRALGVPVWVAQRLWLGTILFMAGAGVLFLLRTLGMRGPGPLVAAFAYGFSPYVLDYAARISVILLPFAGLGWMVGLTVRALRVGGWRHPAGFALVTLIVGGVNATALVYAGVAPLLWVPYAVVVLHEIPWRKALVAVGRIGVLTLGVSLWWIAGLAVENRWGLPLLHYTETVDTVARTSWSSETLRGLGYWFFYGRDKIGPWIRASIPYTQNVAVIALSFALPTIALIGAAISRWRHRAYFVLLVVVGVTLAVGTYPYRHPTPLGAVFKAAATGSTAGLAMRSTGRAVPLVVLGLAVLLGGGLTALAGRRPRSALIASAVIGVLVLVNLVPLWNGTIADPNLSRPEHIPSYWMQAAKYLDAAHPGTRVLEIPGTDFAAYSWGNNLVDPITPGLMDRPYLARELIPWGSPASADLLNALDQKMQEGVLEPSSIAPIARLFGVGDVVYRADLQYERYNTPRPRPTWEYLTAPVPSGLGAPVEFGPPTRQKPLHFPMLDELALDTPAAAPDPPPVSAFPVLNALPIVRAEATAAPLIVAGDGEGLVNMAAVGRLDVNRPIFYSASYSDDPSALKSLAAQPDSAFVLTDTNRRRAVRWSTVRETTGYTEQAGEKPLKVDGKDTRLDVFPGATDASYTVTRQLGVASVQATDYGNEISYTPEDRAARAFDGDPTTAWRTSAYGNPVGERLQIALEAPVTTDHITLLQPINGSRNRYITRVTVTFDGGSATTFDLGPQSRELPGQTVSFSRRTFRTVDIRIDADNVGVQSDYVSFSSVGFAEVGIGDNHVDEVVRLPSDLLGTIGVASASHPLSIVLTRERSRPVPPRGDEELSIARTFSLPTDRTFALSGTARLDSWVPDQLLDSLIGEQGGFASGSSGRMPGNPGARASSALDSDWTTAWLAPMGDSAGQSVEAQLPEPVTFDHLDLRVVADGRHSVPTRLRIDADGTSREVEVPPVTDRPQENATVAAPVHFPALTGQHIRVTIEAERQKSTLEYYSETSILLPVAIAELGIPGVHTTRPGATFDSGCRSDLMTVDGRPLAIRIVGDRASAETLGALHLTPCGPESLSLAAGDHVIRTRAGRDSGLDIDSLVLDSPGATQLHRVTPPTPTVTVRHQGRTSADVHVDGATAPFWLVLGQSFNRGWTAKVTGDADLGQPRLINGYANGWQITPKTASFDVRLEWAPQHRVNVALALSAAFALVCLVLLAIGQSAECEPQDAPLLVAPWAESTRPRASVAVLTELVTLLAGSAIAGPVIGISCAVLVGVALVVPRTRVALLIGAVGSLAAAGAYTAMQQISYHVPSEFQRPSISGPANALGWLAVVLLGADVLVEAALRRRRKPDGDPTGEESASGPSG